jgi:hypothetical protein
MLHLWMRNVTRTSSCMATEQEQRQALTQLLEEGREPFGLFLEQCAGLREPHCLALLLVVQACLPVIACKFERSFRDAIDNVKQRRCWEMHIRVFMLILEDCICSHVRRCSFFPFLRCLLVSLALPLQIEGGDTRARDTRAKSGSLDRIEHAFRGASTELQLLNTAPQVMFKTRETKP